MCYLNIWLTYEFYELEAAFAACNFLVSGKRGDFSPLRSAKMEAMSSPVLSVAFSVQIS